MRLISCLLLLIALACTAHASDHAAKAAWAWASSTTACPVGCNCGCANGQECQCKSATISVSVPADAKLYVDGVLTKTIGKDVRTFSTPALEPDKIYSYAMRIECIRDGVAQSESKVISFKAGQVVKESFSPPPAAIYQPAYQSAPVCITGT